MNVMNDGSFFEIVIPLTNANYRIIKRIIRWSPLGKHY
jgi:hypothetical protein